MAESNCFQAGFGLVLCIFIILFRYQSVRSCTNDMLSSLMNVSSSSPSSFQVSLLKKLCKWYLLWRHPIAHIDGDRQLPTCPYRFPNGQGDVGKFLNGMENSKTWEKQNGSVYRIWSGMRPEV